MTMHFSWINIFQNYKTIVFDKFSDWDNVRHLRLTVQTETSFKIISSNESVIEMERMFCFLFLLSKIWTNNLFSAAYRPPKVFCLDIV